jgi:hypothetical protein
MHGRAGRSGNRMDAFRWRVRFCLRVSRTATVTATVNTTPGATVDLVECHARFLRAPRQVPRRVPWPFSSRRDGPKLAQAKRSAVLGSGNLSTRQPRRGGANPWHGSSHAHAIARSRRTQPRGNASLEEDSGGKGKDGLKDGGAMPEGLVPVARLVRRRA